jgi:hydroxypyruvate isomerase
MPRFSANLTMLFTEQPFLERFGAAARAGFRAVEFVSPYAHPPGVLADLLRAHALEVSVFNLPPGDWDRGDRGLACDPRRTHEFRDGLGRAVEYARALRCDRVHCMAGLRPPGPSDEEVRATYVANLRLAAEELGRHGLTVLVEVINPRDMPGYWLTSSRQAFETMRDVGAPNVKFQYDAYHLQLVEGDLAGTLDRHLPDIGHVQIADAPGRHEPGTGEIDFPFLLRHLDELGYRGWVGCEYRPLGTTAAGLGWLRPWLSKEETR